MMMRGGMAVDSVARPLAVHKSKAVSFGSAGSHPDVTVRKDFPESWIYETFDDLGSVDGGFGGFQASVLPQI